MMTVKEVSKLTGISARTLHYYDEIGLFTPTEKSEAGYRLYDDKALEKLQQILFFREFDIPLKEIKTVMENPALDRNQILRMQKNMLSAKKERIERLIASIDDIMKGDGKMEFTIFNKSEIEEMYDAMASNMSEAQKQIFIEQYGSMEEWRKSFLKQASSVEAQKNYEKVVAWYGSKEAALDASRHPGNADVQNAYQNRMTSILQRIAGKQGKDVNSFAVRSLVGEYDFVIKQLFQLQDATQMALELAKAYQENEKMQAVQDSIYGDGATAYIGRAIEAFYTRG